MVRLAPPDRLGSVVREGGRRVGWSEWGPPDGAPVLFVTGAGMSGSLGLDADAVADLGVRLVAVDRAGLGRSEPDPSKTFDSWAADVGAVLEDAGLGRPPVIGFSQGAPFSVALAGAGLVSAVALVAPQDELADERVRGQLQPDIRELVDGVLANPAGVEAHFGSMMTAEGLYQMVMGTSGPHDRVLYERRDFVTAFRQALDEGFAQGAGGYARDMVLALGRWATPPEAVQVPVALWLGGLDTSPVHSPDQGATLEARFPRAERHVLEAEGSSLLWTRTRDLLADLLALGRGG